MRTEKGSITIFSLLSLLLITATLFALLEGTRLQEMRRFADLQTEAALESVFARYNSYLWSNYHLLGADQTQMEDVLKEVANGREGGDSANLLAFAFEESMIQNYTLLTDREGAIFIDCVSSYMKENLLYESAKEIYNQYEAIKDLMGSSQMDRSKIEEALKAAESGAQKTAENSVGTTGMLHIESRTDLVSILEIAKKLQEFGILELVLEDTSQLSTSEQDFRNGLLERQLKAGKNPQKATNDWMDRILLQQYLLTYMSNFRDIKSQRALSYEVEYILGEKSSDIENLKVVVTRILAIREAANFTYLISNPSKVLQAETMATFIGGATLNPAIIEIIKVGLLTAWSLAESILDVRALLAGKRIPLIKNDENWTIELEKIGKITQEFCMAEESVWGINYEGYLGLLLLFEEEKCIAMRSMNIQEAAIRKNHNDPSFRMDTLMIQAKASMVYTYAPIFPFLKVIGAENKWKYKLLADKNYGYY